MRCARNECRRRREAAQRRRGIVVAVVLMALLASPRPAGLSRLGEARRGARWTTSRISTAPAGRSIAAQNPYTYEPLHTCEHRVNAGDTFRGRLFASNPGVAVPAPQPPYDFVALHAAGTPAVRRARVVDALAIVASVALCAAALAALGVPLELAAAAFAALDGLRRAQTGQIVPFALLALVLCGLALAPATRCARRNARGPDGDRTYGRASR